MIIKRIRNNKEQIFERKERVRYCSSYITIRIEDSVKEALIRIAKERNTSYSKLCKDAIKELIKDYNS